MQPVDPCLIIAVLNVAQTFTLCWCFASIVQLIVQQRR